jgi:DUF1680 family protein
VALRVPTWAEGFAVLVDGQPVSIEEKNGYLVINRAWDKNRIDVVFRASVKMKVINKKIAFTKGPIALARDSRFGDITAPLDMSVKDGKIVRSRRIRNDLFASNIACEIKTKDGRVALCDYAQAGKNYDDDDSQISVWSNRK